MAGLTAGRPGLPLSCTDCSAVGLGCGSITGAGVYSSTIPFEEAHAWRRLVARFKRSGRLEERVRALERAAGIKSRQEEES